MSDEEKRMGLVLLGVAMILLLLGQIVWAYFHVKKRESDKKNR